MPVFHLRIVLLRTVDLQPLRFVDRRLDAQHHAELVVHLDAVGSQAVLHARSFPPRLEIAHHLAAESAVDGSGLRQTLLQKTHHVRTRQVLDGVMQQTSIKRLQDRLGTEGHVGRHLRLFRRPAVVPQLLVGSQSLELGMHVAQEFRQRLGPIGPHLLVQKRLGTREVRNPREAVLPSLVADAGRIQLSRQPLSTVEANLHLHREPGHDPHVHSAEPRMTQVEVVMQALAEGRLDLQFAHVGVLVQFETAAILDATEHGDQPREIVRDAVLANETVDDLLLVARSGEIDDFADRRGLGQSFGGESKLATRAVEEGGESREQDVQEAEVLEESIGEADRAKAASKSDAIETAKNAVDARFVLAYKRLHGMSWVGRVGSW